MRAIVLTSTARRHRFVIDHVASRADLVGVWQEAKSFRPETYARTEADRDVIAGHFAARDAAERRHFGEPAARVIPPHVVHRTVDAGEINEPSEVARMRRTAPDVVLVYGTGLLREGIISAFDGRIINIHLGLSPHYRGSGTNFWPLVNREPECVGATIHFLDAGIDTGPIIVQVRPDIAADDGPHDIGNTAIRCAARALVAAAEAFVRRGVRSTRQEDKGRLYQRKDFSAGAVRRLYENFEAGMIPEYLADKAAHDARVRLVTLEENG